MADIIITVIAVIAGSLMCFTGYKMFRLCLGIAGGVAGFVLGRFVISVTEGAGAGWNETVKLVILLIFTIGLAILAFSLYMKALIAITTIVCAFWFYDDFGFVFERVTNTGLRLAMTYGCGIIAGALIGIIVYYAQKWTISLFTALAGARVIAGVLTPILWASASSNEYVGVIGQRMVGQSIEFSYSLLQLLVVVAFCAAGFVIQLKTAKK